MGRIEMKTLKTKIKLTKCILFILDILIVIASYIISRVFYEYNIPFYVDSKRSIENSKLTLYILNILDMGISSRYNFKNVINM